MPIYEYKCEKCHDVCEALQKFSDPPLSKCPTCGGKVHKLISLNAFHLKGSGWYTTDYAGKNSSTQKNSEAGGKESPAEDKPKKPEKAKKKDDSASA